MKQLFYYAYGSNLLTRRLEARIGHSPFLRNHTLENYNLMFNCGGYANIEPIPGSKVEGSLYAINGYQLKELARYEGFYYMEFFDIPEGLAVVFVGDRRIVQESMLFGAKSSKDYIDIVLEGMAEKGLEISHRNLSAIREVIQEKPRITLVRPAKRGKKVKRKLNKYNRMT